MRKIMMLLTTLVIAVTLTACTTEAEPGTPPSFTGIRIENAEPVVDGSLVRFYKGKQDTVLVEITLDNPDALEIKSIIINGYTQPSTRFLDTSTTDVIYFNMDVGTTLAATTYSVDRINYLDNGSSQSVSVTTNNLFEIYVYKDIPTVTQENYTLERDRISVDFLVEDEDAIIEAGTLVAYLYAGETEIDQQVLSGGLTTASFDTLLTDKLYDVKVYASFDLDDNNGLRTNVILFSGTYSTLSNRIPSATISNVVVTSNNVLFDVSINDQDGVIEEDGLSVGIYSNDILVDTIDLDGDSTNLAFDNLLNDNQYTLKVLADYDLEDGVGVRTNNVLGTNTLNTLPRALPLIALTNLDLQENSIEFDVFIDDPTGIIEVNSLYAKLYVEGEFIQNVEIVNYNVDFQVNNLFANGEFSVEIIGDYDLNDGLGVRPGEIIFTQTFSTLENMAPEINISKLTVLQGYIELLLVVSDPNATLMGDVEVVLFEEGVAVDSTTLSNTATELKFAYPTISGLSYYLEFYADYNLRDGLGAVLNDTLRRVVVFTAEAKAPVAEITNIDITTDELDFDVTVIDADGTIQAGETFVSLYLGDLFVASEPVVVGANSVSFTGLLSDSTYTIVVTSDYNLDDGSGVLQDQAMGEVDVTTLPKALPAAIINNVVKTETTMTFDVELIDEDDVVDAGSAIVAIYREGVLVDSSALIVGDNFNVTFTGLFSDNNYVVVVEVDYDLNDGDGVITDFTVVESTIRTSPKFAPSATIITPVVSKTSITFDVNVTDTYSVITGEVKAILLIDNVPTGDELPLSVGTNSNIAFTGIFSNLRYSVSIVADYDLNNGQAALDDEPIGTTFSISTLPNLQISAVFQDIAVTSSTISLQVVIVDEDGVLTGNLEAILYKDGIPTGDVVPVVVGNNQSILFTGLNSATEYTIEIEADYDMNEITGPVVDEVLLTQTTLTLPLGPPTALLDSYVDGTDQLIVDLEVIDLDNTISGPVVAALYQNGLAEGQTFVLSVGKNTGLTFTGLDSGSTYEIKVFADYDLRDIAGEQLNVEVYSTTLDTLDKLPPQVLINGTVISRSTISFAIDILDDDNVYVDGSLVVALYVDGIFQTQKNLLTNNVIFDISGMLADYDFELRFYGDFDLNDGNGLQTDELLNTYEFTTMSFDPPTAELDGLTINQDNVQVDLTIDDPYGIITGNLRAVLIDNNDIPVETITGLVPGLQTITFNQNLLFNTFYSIVVYTDYNLLNGEGQETDVVLAEVFANVYNKRLPQAEITSIVTTQSTLTFNVDVLDNDTVVVPGSLEAHLYLDGVKVDDETLIVGSNIGISFSGLLSDRTYEIRIVTDYDNGNGNGVYQNYVAGNDSGVTLAKASPTASVTVDTISATQLIFDISITDPDNVASLRLANLYDSTGALVESKVLTAGNNFNVTFASLVGNSSYTLQIDLTYDLDDGAGDQEALAVEVTYTTLNSAPPVATIDATAGRLSELDVTYSFDDVDGVSTEQYLRLYAGAVLVDELAIGTGANQTHTFTGLTPNTEYTIRIESSYDLNDMNGLQPNTELVSVLQATDSFITIISSNTEEVSQNVLEILVDDYENLLTSDQITVTLYEGATSVQTYILNDGTVNSLTLFNLLSEFEYVLEFEASYDIGAGVVVDVVFTYTFEIEPLLAPVILIEPFEFWDLTPTITLDLTVDEDAYYVVGDNSWVAQLLVNGVVVETIDLDATYGNPENAIITIDFATVVTGLDIYTVNILGDLDLQDVPNQGPVQSVLASMSGIDAGN